jgi:hypothetical protein
LFLSDSGQDLTGFKESKICFPRIGPGSNLYSKNFFIIRKFYSLLKFLIVTFLNFSRFLMEFFAFPSCCSNILVILDKTFKYPGEKI